MQRFLRHENHLKEISNKSLYLLAEVFSIFSKGCCLTELTGKAKIKTSTNFKQFVMSQLITELLQKAIKLLKIKDKNQREMLTFSQVICANADEPCV